ncbi:MAG: hypothetical protein ICV65_02060 [Flavisolibacter sp.]|nr:hypothetical protein [Flavisolibacter sp.]
MNRSIIYILLMLLFYTAHISAQKQEVLSIHWKMAGVLPADNGQKQALGFAGPVVGIHNNVLIIAGGANFPDSMPWLGGRKKYCDDVYVLKKITNDSLENYKTFRLPFSVAYAATCTTPQGVLAAGGENENGISNKVFLVQWNDAAEIISIKHLPALPFAVTNASVVADGNFIYLAGGELTNGVSNQFVRFDLNDMAAGWKALPSLLKPVSHAVMVIQSNGKYKCVYVMGGRKKNEGSTSELYASTLQYDLKKEQWSEKNPLPYPLSAGTGTATGAHTILLFGGDKGETFHRTEEVMAAMTNETDEAKKQILNQQKIQVQSTHPGFSKEVLLYHTAKDRWAVIGSVPYDMPVTTTAIKWGNDVFIPSGEIRAGVRTPNILLGKLKP